MPECLKFLPQKTSLARGSVVPPQMIEDLLTVSQVAEAIDTLATSLQAAPGFLDSESFEQIVLESLADDRLASAVVRHEELILSPSTEPFAL